ncbi:MAG: UDP-N-acetylmuramoyl-L-alanine--D-glutamate ligase, partial [Psittacicella sp.]
GSNGKTTTVSILTEVLINFGYKVALGGNVGTPILSLLNSSYDFFVIELSSFQLEAISKLDLEIGVILNITDDHLDRHYSYENYLNIKKKIFKNSKCQIANISLMPFLNEYKGVSYFGEGTNCKYLENSTILLNNLEYNLKTDIRGKQFIYNAIIVLMIINKMDLDLKKAIEYISLFKPSKHRFSLVSRYKDASWIDDSKATNEGSAIAALDNFQKNDDIYLLLGGVSKGCNFLNLKKFLTKFINIKVYAFGESKLKFQDIFKDTILCNTLEEAVLKINNKVKKDSIILLAPGCSSFDQFMNYADRGNKFIEIIGKLNG